MGEFPLGPPTVKSGRWQQSRLAESPTLLTLPVLSLGSLPRAFWRIRGGSRPPVPLSRRKTELTDLWAMKKEQRRHGSELLLRSTTATSPHTPHCQSNFFGGIYLRLPITLQATSDGPSTCVFGKPLESSIVKSSLILASVQPVSSQESHADSSDTLRTVPKRNPSRSDLSAGNAIENVIEGNLTALRIAVLA